MGQSVRTVDIRWKEHWKLADRGKGWSLHAAIRKYGKENFTHVVIAEAPECELPQLEVLFIYLHDSIANGYNLTSGGDGVPCTDEMRKKMSDSQKARPPITEEHRAVLRKAQAGKVISVEQRKIMSLTMTGRTLSPEHVLAISKGQTGTKRTAETKAKMSLAQSGENHPMFGTRESEETKAKKSASLLKYYETNSKPPTSDETKALMSAAKKNDPMMMTRMRLLGDRKIGKPAANKGSTHTEETKLKMKAYWAARREAKLALAA